MTWEKINVANKGGIHTENITVNQSQLFSSILPTACPTQTLQYNQTGFLPNTYLGHSCPSVLAHHMIPLDSLPAPGLFLCNIFMDHFNLNISPFSKQSQHLPFIPALIW